MRGVVSSGHRVTSEVGARMLRSGGTAVDAVVAACAASCIAEPTLTSLGGGGFAVIHDGRTGKDEALDFFVDMPGLGKDTHTMEGFEEVTMDLGGTVEHYYAGIGSATLPGLLPGLLHLHEQGGKLHLRDVLAPAIRLAREGVVITPYQASFIKLLSGSLSLSAESRRIFFKEGRMKGPGDVFLNPDTARFLKLFTRGDWRTTLEEEFFGRILDHMERAPGLITPQDVEHFTVLERTPLSSSFRALELITNPPPSIGGLLITFILKLMEGHDLAALDRVGGEYVGLFVRSQCAATAMRRDVIDGHIRDEGLAVRALSTANLRCYKDAAPGPGGPPTPGNTTHLSVTEAHGTAVALTSSNGENAGYVIPGTGIQYNNMLGESDINPDGWLVNPIGKRLPSSMSPSIVLRDGEAVAVLGSGGSSRIISAIAQVILNHVVFGLDPARAVEAPRVHYGRNELHMEPGYPRSTIEVLSRVFPVNSWSEPSLFFGGVHMATGNTGAGDPRRAGSVVRVP